MPVEMLGSRKTGNYALTSETIHPSLMDFFTLFFYLGYTEKMKDVESAQIKERIGLLVI